MPTKLMLYLPVILTSLVVDAQVSENFTDGNFTENPVWTGTASDWSVSASGQLQSSDTIANGTFYITTASELATDAQWEFYINLKFATSSANYVDAYLTASSNNLSAIGNSGYFVRIGNTMDEISLYRKGAGVANGVKIIDGTDGSVNSSSNNKIKIKVTRGARSQWTLFRDITGTGDNYFNEGTIIDAGFTASSFFGFLVKQSTVAGFARKHFFDDIEVKQYLPDITPPVIQSATPISANELDALFDEPIENISSQAVTNYSANNSIGTPVSAQLDASNTALVHLRFTENFSSGVDYQLVVNGVKDLSGNAIVNESVGFIYLAPYMAQQYDVVIDEIMADPAPSVALPNNEWIELKNTSTAAINLQGWKISDLTGISGGMPNFILLPDSFVIICATGSSAVMSPFGVVITVAGFPSLNNDVDRLSIISSEGKIIHTVNYADDWYQDELKKDGGWTLEMIDTKNPCTGIGNWKASTDTRGGSPGGKNAVDAVNKDETAPKLLRAYAADDKNIVLIFDESLDSLKAADINNYSISDGIGIPIEAITMAPEFTKVNIKLHLSLIASKIYTLSAKGLIDCVGNQQVNNNSVKVALGVAADTFDIVINEILFNPPAAGSDYVEIYNRSNKIIDLKQSLIANRATNGAIDNITKISDESYLLFPHQYIVLTKDIAFVKATYITENPDAFINVHLPSFNDDKGSVLIVNEQGAIIDEVTYSDKWHFKLIDNKEGVALERIDYEGPSQFAGNWQSAATSVGYGTPTYKNSQYPGNAGVPSEIKLSPEIISPDGDGQDDYCTLDYNFPEPGYVANITIFDASSRRVRYLQRNALCGTKGNFRWDGLGEKNQPLATGVYIIFTEVFTLNGKTKQFKMPVVLARRN